MLRQPFLDLVNLESFWPRAALVGDLAVHADDVEPVWLGAIGRVDLIVLTIEQRRHRHFQGGDALLGNVRPLLDFLRLRNLEQFLFAVLEREQNRIGMRLANIDEVELRTIFIGLIDLFEVARLATERRSGIAAENQYDRLLALETGQLHLLSLLQIGQREVRGRVARAQRRGFALTLGGRCVDLTGLRIFLALTDADFGQEQHQAHAAQRQPARDSHECTSNNWAAWRTHAQVGNPGQPHGKILPYLTAFRHRQVGNVRSDRQSGSLGASGIQENR